MECVRESADAWIVRDEDDHILARLTRAGDDAAGFETMALQLAALLAGTARVAVVYREGLIDEVQADLPCEVLLIEHDPFDQPTIQLRRRQIGTPDSERLDALLAQAGA